MYDDVLESVDVLKSVRSGDVLESVRLPALYVSVQRVGTTTILGKEESNTY